MKPKPTVFMLQETDEMRHPYESALAPLSVSVRWFKSLTAMMEGPSGEEPIVIVIDVDELHQPIEPEIELLKTQFPSSELVALSGADTSQLALQCIRSGFSDFLLKPTSPEELAYAVRKAQQRKDVIQRLEDPNSALVRAITRIAGCTSPSLVRVYALEYLSALFQAEGAAWVKAPSPESPQPRVLLTFPKRIESSEVVFELPHSKLGFEKKLPLVLRSRKGDLRKVLVPSKNLEEGFVFLWGIKKKVTSRLTAWAALLMEHTGLTLLNLQKYDEVKQRTFVDDLTGLYNSRYLSYALTSSILRCKQPNQRFSVLFIDVDHFKSINDKHTHLVGSQFLVTIGRTIKNAVRRIDPVFRYGGDEFVVILNDTGTEGAKEIAERIRKNIERRVFVIQDRRIQTTVSIGIATYPEHASDRDVLLRLADEAMYSAKRSTRNSVHLALSAPQAEASE